MPLTLKLSQSVIDILRGLNETSAVSLLGLINENALIIIGIHKHLTNSQQNEDLLLNIPSGIDFCGISILEKDYSTTNITKLLQEIQVTDNPILITRDGNCFKTYFYVHEQLEETDYVVITQEEILDKFMHIRLQTRLHLLCELEELSIKDSLQLLTRKISSGTISFLFPESKVFLISNDIETGLNGLEGEPTILDLWQVSQKDQEICGKMKYKKKSIYRDLNVLPVQMLIKPTRDVKNEQITDNFAPVIKHIKREFTSLKLSLKLDVISIVGLSMKVLDLYGLLVDSLCKHMKLIEKSIINQLKDDQKISMPESFHFYPEEFNHFITIIYPQEYDDKSLQQTREQFHDIFYLPKDRPNFRRTNAFRFQNPTGNALIICPHEFLGSSAVKGGEVSLVRGPYAYHHYMQDKINDDGWGCAYRSLQTIISWFRLNGYTDRPIPSHREIQQCLVDISDKPASFVGSKQWIGSTEVSFCLETLLGVNCRILSVNSGEEMTSKGGELFQHFNIHGTPVMIGGGVLAHTILGVDFNRQTGDLKFLILDPHYTGGEDLNTILNKGWCAWKGPEFWVKSAFYNMCLPIRPRCL